MEITEVNIRNFADYVIDDYVHLTKVEVFNRIEDATTGTHTTVEGNFVCQDADMRGNPSSRRTGVVLHFWSELREEPNDKFVMCIFQHKGNEYIQFQTLTEYEGADQ